MSRPADSRTSLALLGRLRQAPTDQEAWRQFVDRYAPRVYSWCRLSANADGTAFVLRLRRPSEQQGPSLTSAPRGVPYRISMRREGPA
jgi:hypothetical protein